MPEAESKGPPPPRAGPWAVRVEDVLDAGGPARDLVLTFANGARVTLARQGVPADVGRMRDVLRGWIADGLK